jgi:hypothetical protein
LIEDEEAKLKDAVQMHGGKDRAAISTLVTGRTEMQCLNRWHLAPRIDRSTGRSGKWTPDEDDRLKGAVQMHGGKNWASIAVVVSGRTGKQCLNRWQDYLNPSVAPMARRTGAWTQDEDGKLRDSVQAHNGKNWDAIARLVPGRTKKNSVLKGGVMPWMPVLLDRLCV